MTSGNGLDLFISISLTYPELNAVRYESRADIIGLDIALQGEVDKSTQDRFITRVDQYMEFYCHMQNKQPCHSFIEFKSLGEITLIRLERDIISMSEDEIDLLLYLIRDTFSADRIICDTSESITEEPFKLKVKQNLLRRINKEDAQHHFVAFREQGTVKVFQK